MVNQIYLTSEQLDTLTNRVTKKISYLKRMSRESMWDQPIAYCKQIEKSVMAVDTVVLEVMEEKGFFQNNSYFPSNSQMTMVRIYILLYYRHRDEELYNAIVFPALKENMGTFNDKYLNDIHSRLNEVLKHEELIRKAVVEGKKDLKPKFSYKSPRKGVLDELYDEYNEEALFRNLVPMLEAAGQDYHCIIDIAEVWYNAKDVVGKLWQVGYPENYIERILNSQDVQFGQSNAVQPQLMMMCVYAMMRSVKKSDHFKNAIREMEQFTLNYGHGILSRYMNDWKNLLNNKALFDDYDYVGEEPKKETFTSADILRLQQRFEQQLSDMKKQLKEKETEVESLLQQLSEDDIDEDGDNTPVDYDNKPRLALLLKLMEKDGLDINKKGIKKKTVGELMEYLTGIPCKSCKNFLSDTHVDRDHHREVITKFNGMMQSLGMSIRL